MTLPRFRRILMGGAAIVVLLSAQESKATLPAHASGPAPTESSARLAAIAPPSMSGFCDVIVEENGKEAIFICNNEDAFTDYLTFFRRSYPSIKVSDPILKLSTPLYQFNVPIQMPRSKK